MQPILNHTHLSIHNAHISPEQGEQRWKEAELPRQMRITLGVIVNHFGQLIRNIFGLL